MCTSMLFGWNCFAQTPRIDSLKSQLETRLDRGGERVDILNQLGFEYWIIDATQSIIYGKQAESLALTLNDSSGIAFSNRIIGVAYWVRANYDLSLGHLQQALDLYTAINDNMGRANCLMNIGLVYADQLDYDRASDYYFQALELFIKLDAESRSATTYTKLASIYIQKGELENALDFLEQSISIHQKTDFTYGIAEAFNRKATLLKQQNSIDSALYYYQESIRLSTSIGDKEGLARNYKNLAELYSELGLEERAIDNLTQGLQVARNTGSNKLLKEIFNALSSLSRKRGDLQNALHYYEQYSQIRDSIYNEQSVRNLAELEAQIATAEKERQLRLQANEISLLEEKSKMDRLVRIGLVIILVLILISTYLVIGRLRLNARQREERSRLKAIELQQEVDQKNQELTSYSINFVQKNQLLEEVVGGLDQVSQDVDADTRKKLADLKRVISKSTRIDKEWESFKLRFDNLHQGFFDGLTKVNPSLTTYELNLCALIKLNLSTAELANILGISSSSVKMARYRLKKKLDIPSENSLTQFIAQLN